MTHCKNYVSPLNSKACKAGVTFEALRNRHGSFLKWPCTKGHDAVCDKSEWPMPDEIAKEKADMDRRVRMFLSGVEAAANFRMENQGRDNHGTVKCPECGGNLHLTIAASNGHVHGKCETPDCIAWME